MELLKKWKRIPQMSMNRYGIQNSCKENYLKTKTKANQGRIQIIEKFFKVECCSVADTIKNIYTCSESHP